MSATTGGSAVEIEHTTDRLWPVIVLCDWHQPTLNGQSRCALSLAEN
jgi:hypothetical protein